MSSPSPSTFTPPVIPASTPTAGVTYDHYVVAFSATPLAAGTRPGQPRTVGPLRATATFYKAGVDASGSTVLSPTDAPQTLTIADLNAAAAANPALASAYQAVVAALTAAAQAQIKGF